MAIPGFGPLRQQTIFGGDMYRTPPFVPQEPSPTFPTQGMIDPMMNVELPQPQAPIDASGGDMTARFRELYQPEVTATQRFEDLIAQQPVRKRPGKLRKLGASFVALKDPKLAEHFLEAPYAHELEAWQERVKPAYQAAGLERQENIQKRILAGETVKAEQANRKIDIQQQRADVYALKQTNPNLKFDFSGPEVLVADPATGEVRTTGVKTGSLTEADKIALGGAETRRNIRERGAEERKNIVTRNAAQMEQDKAEGWDTYTSPSGRTIQINDVTGEKRDVEVGEAGPVTKIGTPAKTTGTGKEMTLAQIKANATRTSARNPKWAPWIKITGNTVKLTPPKLKDGFWQSGPSPEEYNQMQTAIFGQVVDTDWQKDVAKGTGPAGPPKAPPVQARPSTAPQPQIRRNNKTGQVVISYDGGKTWNIVPPDQVAAVTGQ